MNRMIGITGGMSSGKTTLSKNLLEFNSQFVYVDVDEFRRSLFNNVSYVKELKLKIIQLNEYVKIDSSILNKFIYSDENAMKEYKNILYKYLFDYLKTFDNKTIIVDWALIINDNLIDKFDKIVYLDVPEDVRLSRLKNSDLTREEILQRFKLQKICDIKTLESNKIMVVRDSINMEKIYNFINKMECKFTLPENCKKVIWEITHSCNYGCSYCIFSCNKAKIDGELTTSECFHVIDELVKNNFTHLKITGGEPFIRKDLIEILEYASNHLIVDVSTNASLITNDMISQLNKIKLKMIHVSLDGNKQEHESVRGKFTYDRTINGLNLLKNSKNKIRIGCVIHANNQNSLEGIIQDSINLEADEIIFSIMEPVEGQSRVLMKTIDNNELIDILDKLKEKYKEDIIVNYNFGQQPNYVKECPGGDKFLYINNFGYVSPCPWAYEKDRSCISQKSLKNCELCDILKEDKMKLFLSKKSSGQCYGQI